MRTFLSQILSLLFCLVCFFGQAQLQSPNPFCADTSGDLPPIENNVIDPDGLGEIGCLNTTPNPSFFYIRMEESGTVVFEVKQWIDDDEDGRLDRNERRLDVDFIAWGPFNTPFVDYDAVLAFGCDNDGDGQNLRPAECQNNIDDPDYYINDNDNTNIVDCSYGRETSGTFVNEVLTIPNAQSGEYYLILITNFSNESGVIALEQTNSNQINSGETDCTVLNPGLLDGIGPTCGEFPVILQGTFPDAFRYDWYRADIGTTNFVQVANDTPDPFYAAATEGLYRVEAFDIRGDEVTSSPDEAYVVDVSDAIVEVLPPLVTEESFSGSYTITAQLEVSVEIQVSGFNDFEYQLWRFDGQEFRPVEGIFQSSPVFSNVPAGDYQIVARYANCPISEVGPSETVSIFGYRKYFTPNGDPFNATWTLINAEDQVMPVIIYIFDRHGKLLKQLIPGGAGWDGTYNGKNMPSADYWFRVEFNEPTDPNMRRRAFSGSFSLIR